MRYITVIIVLLVNSATLSLATSHVEFQPRPAVGKDADIRSLAPNTNYGAVTSLSIGEELLDPGWGFVTTLIEFTGLSNYMGATVTNAGLAMYCFENTGLGANIHANPITQAWNESTVTYNNQPTVNFSIDITCPVPSPGYWMYMDITSVVQNWLNGTYPNYGLMFYSRDVETTPGQYISCWSSDYTTEPFNRPILVMDYSYAAIEPASYGHLKVAFR
jgi:hypothetical protein